MRFPGVCLPKIFLNVPWLRVPHGRPSGVLTLFLLGRRWIAGAGELDAKTMIWPGVLYRRKSSNAVPNFAAKDYEVEK